jgi:hypothetical protein
VKKIPLILGLLGMLLGGAILLISILLPVVTDGRTSWDEAMIGIIPGALLLVVSFVIAVAGVILLVVGRKK